MKKEITLITLSADEIEDWLERNDPPIGYETWGIDCDVQEGDFMSSKSSMVNYPIAIYPPDHGEHGHSYEAIGGYYNDGCGHKFHEPITFELIEYTPPVTWNSIIEEYENSIDMMTASANHHVQFFEWLKSNYRIPEKK